jgi:outer membrane receptor protein involved in Fe transport
MNLTPPPPPSYFRMFAVLAVLTASLFAAADDVRRSFAIPAGFASETLKRFAAQAGQEIVFASENVDRVKTNAVSGELTPQEAIGMMLANTGLRANRDAKTGTFAVREDKPVPNAPRATSFAQERDGAPSQSAIVLSEFVVDTSRDTGYLARRAVSVSGLNTPVTDLAQSIEIFTEEFMLDVGATNFEDVLYYSASVASTEHNLEGMAPQAIRGIGSGFVLRNGFRVGRVGGDAVNLERSEIVKGASAILYGQSAVGGVINYVTKVPRAKPRTTLSATYGSWDSIRTTVDTTGPIGASSKILYRLVGSWQEAGTWIDWGFNDITFVSPKLSFLPLNNLRIDISYEHYERNFLFASTVPFDASNNNLPFTPPAPIDWDSQGPKFGIDQQQRVWEGIVTYSPFHHTTIRLAAFQSDLKVDRMFRGGQSGTVETGTGRVRTGTNPATTVAGLAANQGRISREKRLSDGFDFRAEGVTTLSTRLGGTKLFYGAEYNRVGESLRGQGTNPFFGTTTAYYNNGQIGLPAPPVYFDNFREFLTRDPAYNAAIDGLKSSPLVWDVTGLESERWGYYGTLIHTIPNQKLITSFGLRMDEENLEDFVPQFGAVFKPFPWASVYGLYSESWLSQSTTSLPLPDGSPSGYRGPVAPQIGETREVGVKLDLGKAYLTFAAFDMKNSGKLATVGNPNWDPNLPPSNINSNRNVAALKGSDISKGWEISGVTQLTKDWQTTLSFMHLTAVTPPVNVGDEEEVLLGAPRDAFTLWSRYNFARGPLSGLGIGAGVKYAAARRLGGQGNYVDPARWIYEASAFYRTRVFGRDTRLQLNVKNLEDEMYFWDRARYSAPLNWRFTVNTSF